MHSRAVLCSACFRQCAATTRTAMQLLLALRRSSGGGPRALPHLLSMASPTHNLRPSLAHALEPHMQIPQPPQRSQAGFSLQPGDVMLGYLPMAHIFDRMIEELMLARGVRIGYWRVRAFVFFSLSAVFFSGWHHLLARGVRIGYWRVRTPPFCCVVFCCSGYLKYWRVRAFVSLRRLHRLLRG